MNPEPVLLALSFALAGVLASAVMPQTPHRSDRKQAIVVGVLLGILIATKVTAAALLVIVLLLRNSRLIVVAAAACALTFIASTLPIAPKYIEVFSWFGRIAVHGGTYGEGNAGLPEGSLIVQNFVAIAMGAPEIVAGFVLCITTCTIIWVRRTESWHAYTLAVLAAVLAIQMAIVAKHFGLRYLTPLVAILSLANAVVFSILTRIPNKLRQVGALLLVIAVIASVGLAGTRFVIQLNATREFAVAKSALLKRVSSLGCLVVPFEESTRAYSLSYGNKWANSAFNKYLFQVQPDYIEYELGHRRFVTAVGPLDMGQAAARLNDAKCVYFVGPTIGHEYALPSGHLRPVEKVSNDLGQSLVSYAWSAASNEGAGAPR